MDLRRLGYFVVLAEELHFGRAARRLRIAQPSLSQQIRVLERELGVELVTRGARGVELTAAGGALLAEGRRTLVQAERAEEAARRAARGEIGALIVGFMGSAGRNLLPAVVRTFRERHPGVALEVKEIELAETNRAVREGRVDAAFIRPIGEDPELAIGRLPDDALVAVLHEGHRLAARPSVPMAALAEELFVRPNAAVGLQPWIDFLLATCRRAGFEARFAPEEASSLQAIVGLVAAGAGVSVMSATTHTLPRTGVAAVPIDGATMELAVACRRDDKSPALAAFLGVVRERSADPVW